MVHKEVNYITMLVIFFTMIFGIVAAQSPTIKWFYDVNDMSFGQSAAEDVDGDGLLEIVFSTYRNDSSVHVLNAEDGSLLWKYNTGGCNDVAPLIYDVDQDGDFEIVVPGSCNPVTFCFDADSGFVEWQTPTRGSDSPPTIGDIDNDGKLEILHGQFGGYVISINGEDGSVNWDLAVDVNSWIQTAPIIMDVDRDGQLDFVVANWSFGTDHRIFCFRGDNRALIWSDTLPSDVMYHGAAFGDIDNDGYYELTIGDYNGNLFCFNAEDGSLNWQYSLPGATYIGAPTSLADLNNDGNLDVVFSDNNTVAAVNDRGILLWDYNIPDGGGTFRGAAIADINGDNVLDVTFGSSQGGLYSLDGLTGSLIEFIDLRNHYGMSFEINHGPIIADFDKNDTLDVFVVGGHAEYPNIQNNYGRAYSVSWRQGNGPDWTMFRRDHLRSACVCPDTLIDPATAHFEEDLIIDGLLFPNPATDDVNLRFTLQRAENLQVKVYNVLGELIYFSGERMLLGGVQNIVIKKDQLQGSGIYFVKLGPKALNKTYKFVFAE